MRIVVIVLIAFSFLVTGCSKADSKLPVTSHPVIVPTTVTTSKGPDEYPTTPESPEKEDPVSEFASVPYADLSKEERYTEYAKLYPNYDLEKVVTYVNMNLDVPFYDITFDIESPDDLLVLCNKYFKLPDYFVPTELTEVPNAYHVGDGKEYLLKNDALDAFISMSKKAASEGITLKMISAYRSNSYQEGLYNRYKSNNGQENADKYSARPGHSEHETGLAVDINQVSQAFEDTDAFKWLQVHAHEYGFILRYPKESEHETGYIYEPWHYRYIGIEKATEIKQLNITFDAYHARQTN